MLEPRFRVLATLLLFSVVGCAGPGPRKAPLRAPDPALKTDPQTLLNQAQERFRGQQWSSAARLYSQSLRAELNEEQRVRALEGLAQSRRAMGDCAGSNRALTTLLDQDAQALDAQTRQRLHYERGICHAELLDWEQSAMELERALDTKHDPGLARLMELHARRGLALFQQDKFDEAQKEFNAGIGLYASLDSEVRERLADPYFLAMAHFYLGAIAHRRFTAITLNLPESRMAKELEEKVQLIETLQSHYHDAIRVRHVFWVSAAGYQLGSAFEQFYDEMMQSPVPPRLSPAQRAVFYTELKKKIRPILLRAVDVYEKNLAAAKRLGYSTPFVQDTEARLAQLQHYLVSEMSSGPFAPPPLAQNAQRQEGGEGPAELQEAAFIPEPTPL